MARRLPTSLLLLVALATQASAHAILLSSTPAAKRMMKGPDIAVELKFNSRIDAKRSRLALVSSDGGENPLSIGPQPSPEIITSTAKGLKTGAYLLRWQVLASDGHITRGEIPFSVQ